MHWFPYFYYKSKTNLVLVIQIPTFLSQTSLLCPEKTIRSVISSSGSVNPVYSQSFIHLLQGPYWTESIKGCGRGSTHPTLYSHWWGRGLPPQLSWSERKHLHIPTCWCGYLMWGKKKVLNYAGLRTITELDDWWWEKHVQISHCCLDHKDCLQFSFSIYAGLLSGYFFTTWL